MKRRALLLVLPWLLAGGGCSPSQPGRVQGYVEGEFVYLASPQSGSLQTLAVSRGTEVKAGDLLFALDPAPEKDALDEAQRRLDEARATLADARKGKRESEIASLQNQVSQAQAASDYSAAEWERQTDLSRTPGAGSKDDLEKARANRDADAARLAQTRAELETARLGARDDVVTAGEANVRALEATVARARWQSEQKSQSAPTAGVVFDTIYRQGEWVEAGRPVIALLPPQNVKVRAFVPETSVGKLRQGQEVTVHVDGVANPFKGTISFISPQAEYTPPVIYSDANRAKLVFMIEAVFSPEAAAQLHPGQPVDVQLPL